MTSKDDALVAATLLRQRRIVKPWIKGLGKLIHSYLTDRSNHYGADLKAEIEKLVTPEASKLIPGTLGIFAKQTIKKGYVYNHIY
jgi:hypothetical protein